jgi:penicillin-insensitive murein endopeptidase
MRIAVILGALALVALPASGGAYAATAKQLFGAVHAPNRAAAPRAIGFYARGCLSGADSLPLTGPDWQVMRLSRNRHYGTTRLVSFIERLAGKVPRVSDWRGLLIGDMSQPRGGPMTSGHASHQIGLDVDIWLTAMPAHTLSREARETMVAHSVVARGGRSVDPRRWSRSDAAVLKAAASDPEVARIFVAPAIKQALCESAGADRRWLRKIRPWYDHVEHFHVRLTCAPGNAACKGQKPPPPGDGCGAELASWFRPPPPHPKPKKPRKPPRPVMLSDLPPACAAVLKAP